MYICGKLIYGHLLTSSCLVAADWQMNDILAWRTAFYTGTSCLNTKENTGLWQVVPRARLANKLSARQFLIDERQQTFVKASESRNLNVQSCANAVNNSPHFLRL